nr:PREDICTED: BRCA1-associated protein-like [Latimeria chalumnae]|eukprot:XP_014354387.1 PREDICTED: BRCA1-associated protein-like [Latimeria chalumnae]
MNEATKTTDPTLHAAAPGTTSVAAFDYSSATTTLEDSSAAIANRRRCHTPAGRDGRRGPLDVRGPRAAAPSAVPLIRPSSRSRLKSRKRILLTTELNEEQEMNKCLRANQAHLQNSLKEEERKLLETCEQKDLQVADLQEQLHHVMFYLETQWIFNQMPADARQYTQEGQITIAMASCVVLPPSGNTNKLFSRKGRDKRGKF